MNKRIIWFSAAVVTALALSFSAFAQPGGGPGRGPGGPGGPGGQGGPGMMMPGMGGGLGMFVRNPEVPKMLEMTPEQVESVQKIFDEARSQFQTQFRQQQGTPPNIDEIRKQMEEVQTKAMQVLKPEQQLKFKQIHFQAMGGLDTPFLNDRMLEVLNLTSEQKDKLRQMQDERMAMMRENFQKFREMSEEDREKMRTKTQEDLKKFSEQVKGLLTAEQKAQAEKLSAGAAEVREKLGMPAQPFQGRGQMGRRGPDGQGRGPGGNEYRPGNNSWRPGQGTPDRGGDVPPPGNRRFPRSEN